MTVLKLYEYPHPVLKQKTENVEKVDKEVQKLLDDMLETMYVTNGVGLAGNQVGKLLRVVVVDCAGKDEPPNPIKLVNPEIIAHSDVKVLHSEGCLSVPREYADVERYESVTVRYLDENGKEQTKTADGLLAIAFQHEIDHLDGKLFIDYLSQFKRHRLLHHLEKRRRKESKSQTED